MRTGSESIVEIRTYLQDLGFERINPAGDLRLNDLVVETRYSGGEHFVRWEIKKHGHPGTGQWQEARVTDALLDKYGVYDFDVLIPAILDPSFPKYRGPGCHWSAER